jgi:O-antigen/teichoic acid export membrane protein
LSASSDRSEANAGALGSGEAVAGYGRGAALLSVGIGATGLITYAYFSLASHSLSESDYGGVTLLWAAVFITVSVLYRPVEQLLSRTIADRDARGLRGGRHLRVAATIQLLLGALFAGAALLLREPIEDELFGGSATLYWILIATVLAYAASYFARGFLAGHRRFGLYGGLVLLESTSRCLFAVAVAIGITSGQSAVALGMIAAPVVSLAVIPWALGRRGVLAAPVDAPADPPDAEFTLSRGAGFAVAVLLIMLSEQAFLNAGPLVVKASEGAQGAAVAGFTFNVLLIARAPMQLFQAVQTSILPHLTRLRAGGQATSFQRSVNATLAAVAAFAAVVTVAMLALGPELMDLFFGGDFEYGRGGLALIALGMGLYLCAATLNQALLARARARQASACWVAAAAGFVGFLLLPGFDDRVLQVETGYVGAALVLCALLYGLYRRG